MYIQATSHALLGIRRASNLMDRSAANIANGEYGVRDIVNVKQASHAVRANAAVIRAADDMTGHLIDILA
ncbi:MAG: hypothetical protein KDB27_18045 [Planctomycetales bacterium]|nr:hypothetical protein [Planctomycetales bacterium]